MTEVFGDTAGWANAFIQTESSHSSAAALFRKWRLDGTRIVTTNYIIAELMALLTSPLRVPRVKQIEVLQALMMADWIEIVHIDYALHNESVGLFTNRSDKLWSLTDCASFVVMKQRGIQYALILTTILNRLASHACWNSCSTHS